MRNVILRRNWRFTKKRFWEPKIRFSCWRLSYIPIWCRHWRSLFRRYRLMRIRLPVWTVCCLSLMWRVRIIISVRLLRTMMYWISVRDVTLWLKSSFRLVRSILPMTWCWTARHSRLSSSPVPIWPVSPRSCVRRHWLRCWRKSVRLFLRRVPISVWWIRFSPV